MIKYGVGALALVLLAPAAFVVLLAGPQAATESAGIATACRLVLGIGPTASTTVGELGGPEAEVVAAALSQPVIDPEDPQSPPTPGLDPAEVAAALQGERAFEFVSSLNTIDNWRSLPLDTLSRWALDPPGTPLPEGAQLLPELPAEQINAVRVNEQPESSYLRSCAAVISRATQIEVDPAGTEPGGGPGPDTAATAGLAGAVTTNLDLLRTVDPGAMQDDPRQFYLNYRPVPGPESGDIVVYDFTAAGPAHFGIALDGQQMVTTGSFTPGVAGLRPIPANSSAMTVTPYLEDHRKAAAP